MGISCRLVSPRSIPITVHSYHGPFLSRSAPTPPKLPPPFESQSDAHTMSAVETNSTSPLPEKGAHKPWYSRSAKRHGASVGDNNTGYMGNDQTGYANEHGSGGRGTSGRRGFMTGFSFVRWARLHLVDLLTMVAMGAIGLGVYEADPAPTRSFPVL
jgi:hypothetical protein